MKSHAVAVAVLKQHFGPAQELVSLSALCSGDIGTHSKIVHAGEHAMSGTL